MEISEPYSCRERAESRVEARAREPSQGSIKAAIAD